MNSELEDQLYAQVAKEISTGNYLPAPMARAVEQSAGNADLAKSLYVKFRIEQLKREVEQEALRQQQEAERAAQAKEEQIRQRFFAERAKRLATDPSEVTKQVSGVLIAIFILLFLICVGLFLR